MYAKASSMLTSRSLRSIIFLLLGSATVESHSVSLRRSSRCVIPAWSAGIQAHTDVSEDQKVNLDSRVRGNDDSGFVRYVVVFLLYTKSVSLKLRSYGSKSRNLWMHVLSEPLGRKFAAYFACASFVVNSFGHSAKLQSLANVVDERTILGTPVPE